MTETRLFLIRHAEPEPSSRGRCYGKLDVALSAEGRVQAARMARSLSAHSFHAVYASPRRRALETAQAIRPEVLIEEDFREIDFGLFEGRPYDEIRLEYHDVYRQWMEAPTTVKFPGGESYAEMQTRVLAALERLLAAHAGQTVAVVAHGGTCRIVLAAALRIADADVFRIGQSYAGVNLIRYLDGFPIVERVNATLDI